MKEVEKLKLELEKANYALEVSRAVEHNTIVQLDQENKRLRKIINDALDKIRQAGFILQGEKHRAETYISEANNILILAYINEQVKETYDKNNS